MASTVDKTLYERVESSLDSIRPYLQKDGGDIELVEITEEMLVKVRLLGACVRCPMSFMTMKAGVEENMRSSIPEISGIEAVNLVSES